SDTGPHPADRLSGRRRLQGRRHRAGLRSRRRARPRHAVVAARARGEVHHGARRRCGGESPVLHRRAAVTEVIGLDLGGTKIAVARLTGTELSESLIKPTDRSSQEALINQLVDMVGQCRQDRLDGVGLGAPSVVEFETGRVVSSANVPLADVPLREVLGDRLGVPVFVDNDATVAALAEAHDEDLRMVARDLVMITVGTGVGGGLVLGGRIYRGATGGAGELGHTIVGMDLNGPVPDAGKFPQKGSLEAVGAGHALDTLVAGAAAEHPDSVLGLLRAEGKKVSGVEAV